MSKYRTVDVEVQGGTLRAGLWGDRGPVLLCSHGITANHVSFELLAQRLGDRCRLVAPDHRGRGGSNAISGPWGMSAHAADMAALLDYLDIDRVEVMVGHSMGGFISAVTQASYPERIGAVIMADGGLPLFDEAPEGVTPEQVVEAIIGPAMARLEMRFESVEAYYDFWRAHPAFVDDSVWSEALKRYFAYDLVGEAPSLRSGANKAAVIGDTESQLMTDEVPRALANIEAPVRFLQAPRGIMNEEPLYPMERVALYQSRIRDFSYRQVPDVNHYTIMLAEKGVDAVVEEVEALLAQVGLQGE